MLFHKAPLRDSAPSLSWGCQGTPVGCEHKPDNTFNLFFIGLSEDTSVHPNNEARVSWPELSTPGFLSNTLLQDGSLARANKFLYRKKKSSFYRWENQATCIVLQIYTYIDVHMSSVWGFQRYKNDKWSHMFHGCNRCVKHHNRCACTPTRVVSRWEIWVECGLMSGYFSFGSAGTHTEEAQQQSPLQWHHKDTFQWVMEGDNTTSVNAARISRKIPTNEREILWQGERVGRSQRQAGLCNN